MPMPTPFLWGVATSSYQIEGAPDNDWVEWERLGRLRVRDERCGGATGHRERWRSDFDLLASLGANAYRFSLEGSVLEPVRGWFRRRLSCGSARGSMWLEGFRPRFGLFEVDYATLARRRRPSADLFGELGRRFTGEEVWGSSAASRR
jgi:beta-glucosidase/6-phospho-beta-glucosidase/beta-galactosidase